MFHRLSEHQLRVCKYVIYVAGGHQGGRFRSVDKYLISGTQFGQLLVRFQLLQHSQATRLTFVCQR